VANNLRAKRQRVTFFVSYARQNQRLAGEFIDSFNEVLNPSKAYEYHLWMDSAIPVGETWEEEIARALDDCDIGLLLLSPAFLGSRFISESELPRFVGQAAKPAVPVMLAPIDLALHDLQGLEANQIFRHMGKRYTEPRSYTECRTRVGRDEFLLSLFSAVESKLGAAFSKTTPIALPIRVV